MMKEMKNLLTILLILLPLSAYAWGVVVSSGGVAAGGGGEAPECDLTCNTGTQDFSSGDNESFEAGSDGSFCTADWVVNDADGVVNTSDNAQKHCGSYSLSMVCDSDITGTNNIQADLGAEDGDIYLRFYFRCPSIVAYKVVRFLLFYSANADYVVGGVRARDWGAGEHLMLERGSTVDDETIPVTAGEWYRVDLHIVGSAGDMTMRVYDDEGNGVLTSSGGSDYEASLASANYNTQIIRFYDYSDHADAITYYVDDITVSTSGAAYIGECSCP